MKVDSNDPRPAYVQLADELRVAIRAGDLAPGERLPTGKELAASAGVAVMTVRQALEVLRSEGLIRTVHGRGAFVTAGADGGPSTELGALRIAVEDLTRRVQAIEARNAGAAGRQLGE